MEPVPEIDLAELVKECIPIARREFANKIRDGRVWASYWAHEAQKHADKAEWKKILNEPLSPWMRPY